MIRTDSLDPSVSQPETNFLALEVANLTISKKDTIELPQRTLATLVIEASHDHNGAFSRPEERRLLRSELCVIGQVFSITESSVNKLTDRLKVLFAVFKETSFLVILRGHGSCDCITLSEAPVYQVDCSITRFNLKQVTDQLKDRVFAVVLDSCDTGKMSRYNCIAAQFAYLLPLIPVFAPTGSCASCKISIFDGENSTGNKSKKIMRVRMHQVNFTWRMSPFFSMVFIFNFPWQSSLIRSFQSTIPQVNPDFTPTLPRQNVNS